MKLLTILFSILFAVSSISAAALDRKQVIKRNQVSASDIRAGRKRADVVRRWGESKPSPQPWKHHLTCGDCNQLPHSIKPYHVVPKPICAAECAQLCAADPHCAVYETIKHTENGRCAFFNWEITDSLTPNPPGLVPTFAFFDRACPAPAWVPAAPGKPGHLQWTTPSS